MGTSNRKRGKSLLFLTITFFLLAGTVYYFWGSQFINQQKKPILQVNVKDYGAVGDGSVNDTTAFQDAINDLHAKGGGDIYIPEGTYLIHSIFLKPYINLLGENRDTVTLKFADDAPDGQVRVINMDDHTKVQKITCDGNYQMHPNGTEHMHCIFAFDNDHILIDNNRLKNAVGDGISISGTKKASNDVIISNNIVEENQRSQIVIEQVNKLKIFNNNITSVTGRPGIHFEPWEKIQYFDAKIYGNTITTNTKGYAVLLTGAEYEKSKNGGTGYFYHGIEFYQNTVNSPSGMFRIIDTSGAKLYDNKLNVKYVHVWRKNKSLKIYSNSIQGEIGILVEGGWNGKLVSNGTKINENKINTIKEGVSILDGADNISINNNTFTGSGEKSGIQLLASENIKNISVSNNDFRNFENGVYCDYVSSSKKSIKDVSIFKNKFIDLKENALYVQGSVKNLEMDNNDVNHSSGAFIYVHEGHPMSNISITNNSITGGKYVVFQDELGNGSLNGMKVKGNQISN